MTGTATLSAVADRWDRRELRVSGCDLWGVRRITKRSHSLAEWASRTWSTRERQRDHRVSSDGTDGFSYSHPSAESGRVGMLALPSRRSKGCRWFQFPTDATTLTLTHGGQLDGIADVQVAGASGLPDLQAAAEDILRVAGRPGGDVLWPHRRACWRGALGTYRRTCRLRLIGFKSSRLEDGDAA